MVHVQLDLDKEEYRIVKTVQAYYDDLTKPDAVKKIIKEFGKGIKITISSPSYSP